MTTNLKLYLVTIENALKAGNATEHTYRPALKTLLESIDQKIIATNEPKRIACGAPDYILTRSGLSIGYVEAKDAGKSLDETERSEQLNRYRRALDNLILTDYLEFRWYVGGELRQSARLAKLQSGGKLKIEKDGLQNVDALLQNFLAHQTQLVNSPAHESNHLLPRLFGFELLMAPYAVAHFKLSLQLAGRDLPASIADQWAYYPVEGERLGVYLTNTLEEAHEMTGLPLFTQWVADETNAANDVKRHLPVLIVIGNPPYSVSSSNKGEWIEGLMANYKKAVRSERNIQPLSDDYIKFIRLAQDRIDRTEQGIVGIITNHAYLSGLIHRGMREELMKSFTAIYVLNLHGNITTGETSPNGGADENVFDIRQGVAIALFVKQKKQNIQSTVHFSELWGKREQKYEYLRNNDISTMEWQSLTPQAPNYFFVPQDTAMEEEYKKSWSITNIFQKSKNGVQTGHDKFAVDIEKSALQERLSNFFNPKITDREVSEAYGLGSKSGWNFSGERLKAFKEQMQEDAFTRYFYRPFDYRWIYYNKNVLKRPVTELMPVLLYPNIALVACRQQARLGFRHVFVTTNIGDGNAISLNSREWNSYFPLYLYPNKDASKQRSFLDITTWIADETNGSRTPNLNSDFVLEVAQKLGLAFTPNTRGDLQTTFGPEDIFHYIYAILHNPTYRIRYAESLKIDFPRVPLTSNVELFRVLCGLGQELVALHLLESPVTRQYVTRYPVAGDNFVAKGFPKYVLPKDGQLGEVHINKTQFFSGISPDIWKFQIGGYRPAQKWLTDRVECQLSYDDLTHYQQMIVALKRTKEVMMKIDDVVPEWPIQ